MTVPLKGALARRRLGVVHLFFFVVAASAPLTVLGGGVTTTYAVTGSLGVPLSFIVLALILGRVDALGSGGRALLAAAATMGLRFICACSPPSNRPIRQGRCRPSARS